MKETDIILELMQQCPSNESVSLGIGDDAAVLRATNVETLVCKDMLLDGVHFRIADTEAARIGHKALGVNLSDIAAMGGHALSAYIAVALPRSLCTKEFISSLYRGIEDLASTFNVAIAGGDTNVWEGPFVISVTALGHSHSRGAVTRSGARVGDIIYVTGVLGDSYASGHHLDFTPRLHEARSLMDAVAIHSMIDISDGLAKDLRTICAMSNVRGVLDPEKIPLRTSLCKMERSTALVRALSDGEDFELCFTVSASDAEILDQNPSLNFHRIGYITEGQGLAWDLGENKLSTIHAQGYEHRA